MPETQFESGQRLIAGFERLGVANNFGTPEATADYLRETPFEVADRQFAWLNRVALGASVGAAALREGHVTLVLSDADKKDEEITSDDVYYIPSDRYVAGACMEQVYNAARAIDDPEMAGTLLQLGIYLTQRRNDGHSRTGAIVHSLRTRGFDESDAAGEHYAQLAMGKPGIDQAGLSIDVAPLSIVYTDALIEKASTKYEYAGPVPEAMTPYNIADLARTRLDLPKISAVWAGQVLAEQYFGVGLAVDYALRKATLHEYITKDATDRVVIDSEAFFSDLDGDDIDLLLDMHSMTKVKYLAEIVRSFKGAPNVFGTADELMASVRQSSVV